MKHSAVFVFSLTFVAAVAFVPLDHTAARNPPPLYVSSIQPPTSNVQTNIDAADISIDNPMRVIISGAGVGGLALARNLSKNPKMEVVVLERTEAFKRFGGPIQLASNALQVVKEMDQEIFEQVMEKFTFTGDKENGIKDGKRTEWYAKFDLKNPANDRSMPYTGVIDRPDLQEIYLNSLPDGVVQNGDGVSTYTKNQDGSITVTLESGRQVHGDVLIGADGIWSAVRAKMHDSPVRGEGSGATYSGYTVFAGELQYDSPDNSEVGYKVYIGPKQYFVITDIGNGRYQWYAFLARGPGSVNDPKPEGSSKYIQNLFLDWSDEIHSILRATTEDEIEQRDLYDRPPTVGKPWTDGHVALLGDGVHAMMPNLGQGGCQAIEDAYVIGQELESATSRKEIGQRLQSYHQRRLLRSAIVQGLSRFASDIIIRGFDTPTKVVWEEKSTFPRIENLNYAGVVTRLLQPILPVFFAVQFDFLYDGWKNESSLNARAVTTASILGGISLLLMLGETSTLTGSFPDF